MEPPAASKPAPRRRGGIVVPHRLAWHQRLAAALIYSVIRAVSWTLRYQWELHPALLARGTEPALFATWHNRLALSLILYEGFVRRAGRRHQLAALVSASKDGSILARVLELFRVQAVRGSSSRRGPQALLELTTWAQRGYDVAITPDGPRGPCYQVQTGVAALAQLTARPVVPVSCELGWKFSLRSWDRFQVPLPFSRCRIIFDAPLSLPPESDEAQREAFRLRLETRLRELTVD